jgi:hypothetical protein
MDAKVAPLPGAGKEVDGVRSNSATAGPQGSASFDRTLDTAARPHRFAFRAPLVNRGTPA